MRVVYVSHCAQLAGAELALLRLLQALAPVDAHVVLGEDGPLVSRLERARIAHEIVPLARSVGRIPRGEMRLSGTLLRASAQAASHARRLRTHFRRLEPDLVHCNALKSALYGGVAARSARIPVVWHAREPLATNGFPALAQRLVRTVAATVPTAVVGDTVGVLRDFPTGRASVHVIPSPIDYESLRRVPLRDQTSTEIVVGMISRLSPVKGQDLFLRAVARARTGRPVRAVVVGAPLFGEAEYERHLHDLADELGIENRVTFRGFKEDVAAELGAMDIVVVPSLGTEAFAQAAAEGMAAARAVVATNAGGPAEIIEDGRTGVLFRPGDVDQLAQVLSKLVDDAELRGRLGTEGRSAAARFAPTLAAERTYAMYEQALGRRSGAGRP